jgi:hypothetical protein
MKSWKREFLENYVYGFVTGLGAMSLIALTYLRAILELQYIGPAHPDYGWVTFITGTTNPNGEWYASIVGYANSFMVVALFIMFIGIILAFAKIIERSHKETD